MHHDGIATYGLGHVAIKVKDMERSAKFYMGLFNMSVFRQDDDILLLSTPGKYDRLALLRSENGMGHEGVDHFGFFTDEANYDKALEYVRSHSIKILGGPGVWPTGSRYIYIADPDGHKVEILTATFKANDPSSL